MTLVPSNVRRAVKVGFAELDRDRARLARQIESFLAKMERNPISALNLRYVVRKGIVGDPFEIKGKWVSMKLHLELRDASKLQTKWVPRKYQEGDTTIQPIFTGFSPWGVVIAFKVAHKDPDFRLKLSWFRKSDPASGPVYLVDPVRQQYMHLTASSLRGEVVPGIPRTGLLVFQNPEYATDRLQVHFSSVRVSKASRNRTSFSLECTSASLPQVFKQIKAGPTLSQQLLAGLDREVSEARSDFLREAAGPWRHLMH